LVIEQLPGTLAHGTCELHAALVLAQVPIDEQSDELRHFTLASFAQVPRTSGQVPGLTLQAAFGGLLQVPCVRHCRSAAAWVAPLQTLPVFAPAFLQVPGVVGHCAAEPQAFCVHALPPQSAVVEHTVVPLGQVFCAQVPPAVDGQLAPLVHALAVHDPTTPPQAASLAQTVVPFGQVFWLHAPLIVVHCAVEVQAWPGGLLHVPQSAAEMQTFPVLLQANCGQSVFFVQDCDGLRLQVPPRIAQSLTDVHRLPRLLQWPTSTQSDWPMQALPVTLHAPACGTQLALDVQLSVVWMLHLPGSGVHVGGGQVVIVEQVFSGSGGSRLQPGGS
jgi:hypothetical protein